MTANFYCRERGGDCELLVTKNLDIIPQVETFVMFNGIYIVDEIYFDLNKCVYNIYLDKQWIRKTLR